MKFHTTFGYSVGALAGGSTGQVNSRCTGIDSEGTKANESRASRAMGRALTF